MKWEKGTDSFSDFLVVFDREFIDTDTYEDAIYFAMARVTVSFAVVMLMMLRCGITRTRGCCSRLNMAEVSCDVPARRRWHCSLGEAINSRSLLTRRFSCLSPSFCHCAYRRADMFNLLLFIFAFSGGPGGHRCCRRKRA